MKVVINHEFCWELFGYADGVKVLEPQSLAIFMRDKLVKASGMYD